MRGTYAGALGIVGGGIGLGIGAAVDAAHQGRQTFCLAPKTHG